ncbi:DNA-binding GntR family transcriptional regulator [Mesorhizobium sp. J18]|uniref:GntR family transcriptional regulator n=1 Tax=Mesorhizobium sp. J18 TaxID=935263 RepID=UPI00119AE31A|nr:GntR family transcriptional regulator [Mesorhizobium sp. J18]TWG97311.1 DNA-binding GntR family transcriptional regulator [Mesorhizobium sp. J18]
MSYLEPIAVSSIANEAFNKLTQAILSGEFAPGERLSEAELARRFGISRGPIREALGRLEGKLVTRMPRVGVSVIDLSPEMLLDLFAVREALEGMAARLAAERVRGSEIEELNELLEQHGGHPDVASGAGYYQAANDDDFHFRIVRIARNEQLEVMLLNELYYKLKLYRYRISSNPGRAQKALEEHREIVKAIASRNPEAAEAVMRTHIRNAIAAAVNRVGDDDRDRRTT